MSPILPVPRKVIATSLSVWVTPGYGVPVLDLFPQDLLRVANAKVHVPQWIRLKREQRRSREKKRWKKIRPRTKQLSTTPFVGRSTQSGALRVSYPDLIVVVTTHTPFTGFSFISGNWLRVCGWCIVQPFPFKIIKHADPMHSFTCFTGVDNQHYTANAWIEKMWLWTERGNGKKYKGDMPRVAVQGTQQGY